MNFINIQILVIILVAIFKKCFKIKTQQTTQFQCFTLNRLISAVCFFASLSN